MQTVRIEISNGIATVTELPEGIEVVIIDRDPEMDDDISRFTYARESGEIVMTDFGLAQ